MAGWLRAHDPEHYGLHRGVRTAIAATVMLVFGTLVGNPQISLIGVFGAVATLLFVEFPGNRQARWAGYAMLGIVGLVLICLGTLASANLVLSVAGMAVFGFVILFAGVLSAGAAAAGKRGDTALPAAGHGSGTTLRHPAEARRLDPRVGGVGLAVDVSVAAPRLRPPASGREPGLPRDRSGRLGALRPGDPQQLDQVQQAVAGRDDAICGESFAPARHVPSASRPGTGCWVGRSTTWNRCSAIRGTDGAVAQRCPKQVAAVAEASADVAERRRRRLGHPIRGQPRTTRGQHHRLEHRPASRR